MKRIVFMGTPDFSVPVLDSLVEAGYEIVLVVTQPDRPKGRKKILTASPVKEAAQKFAIPVFQPEKLKQDFQPIIDCQPDLIVTAAYGQILPADLLQVPEFGCINVHASLLPELRGGAPIHYAILQGKKETGVTIMYMVEKLDAGDILTQTTVPIADDDNVGILHDKLSHAGADLLLETLPKLANRTITPQPQNESLVTFAANIKREQEKIDWTEPNDVVYNQIRGLNPWPVAFTSYFNQQMKIWWGEPDNQVYQGDPGEIVRVGKEAFTVVCGNGQAIQVTEIQPAGKKRMTVDEYLRGAANRIQSGVILGDKAHE
ncbi:methionyl-tRNA formyltransferase [Lentibacillus sp. N15]|uniref:methionyl-tRNA formyltransferase n=1 Tax=Lentibacillus songyuanensis TaxID=3136161 RepID=UPI0031BB09C4